MPDEFDVMITSDADDLVLPAWAKALAAVENVTKTREADTGKYKYSYADLGDVLDECGRVLEMFGLTMHQTPSFNEAGTLLTVRTIVYHSESGQWITWPPLGMVMPKDPQAYGSSLTYARRYGATATFNIATEDDDGAAATAAARAPAQYGGWRSGAEQQLRALLGEMPAEVQKEFVVDFKKTFGKGLSDLPVSKHGDALTFATQWKPAADADEAWRQEALAAVDRENSEHNHGGAEKS